MTSATATATSAPAPASTNGLFARIAMLFATLGAAHRAKVAIEAGRQPQATDLHVLGIDPSQMPSLRGARV